MAISTLAVATFLASSSSESRKQNTPTLPHVRCIAEVLDLLKLTLCGFLDVINCRACYEGARNEIN